MKMGMQSFLRVVFSFFAAASFLLENNSYAGIEQPGGRGEWLNVKDFGAKGDGVTNDSPSIQKAIDSLAEKGGTVYVPAGHYHLEMMGEMPVECPAPQNLVGYAVRIPSRVTLVGDGPQATVFLGVHKAEEKEQYSLLVVNNASDVIIEKVGAIFDKRKSKPGSGDFYVDDVEQYPGQRLQSGIDIRFSKRVTVRDCYLERCTQGVSVFFGNSDILVDNIRAHNCYGCGVGVYAGKGRAVVTNSIITDCSDGMLSSYANAGETEFLNNRVECTPENQRGDKYTQLITVEMSRFVKVIGNHLKGGVPGIDVKRTKDTLILGNTLTDCVWGITVRAGDYAGGAGYSWRTLISGNILENFRNPSGAGAFGIRVSTALFAAVEGNILSNIDGDAITVSRYGEYREGNWPLSGRGISVANNIIVRRTEEYTDDPVSQSVVSSADSTPIEKWDPLDPTEEPPKDLFNDAHRAIIASGAPGISITGNVVRGGALATWPHAGGIVVSDCDGFTFTGNTIGDGNQGRGLLIEKSSGTVSANAIQGALEYALRLSDSRLMAVTGNRISYYSPEGAAILIDGASTECTVVGNTIISQGLLIREAYDGKKELSHRNTFSSNRGLSTGKMDRVVLLEGPESTDEGNVFTREATAEPAEPVVR